MVPYSSPTRVARPAPSRSAVATLLAFAPAILLFVIGGLVEIRSPGLYMDALTPDYIVVRTLNPAADVPIWTFPGALLFNKFPIIAQIYHGALTYYVGLPAYAVFGTGIVGIRLTNLMYGLLVLVSAGLFLQAFRVRPVIIGLCLAAFALEPGLLFAFRTQFFINLLPCAPLLLSIALVEGRREAGPGVVLAAVAGFLAALSVYGYFIYLFLAPVAGLHALWAWRREPRRVPLVLGWLAGFALGGSLYLFGFAMMIVAMGGVRNFLAFLSGNVQQLAVASSVSLPARMAYFAQLVEWTLLDVGPPLMMLRKVLPPAAAEMRLALLLGLPALGVVLNLVRPPRSPGLFVAAGLFVGTGVLVLVFGSRVWLQHTIMLLPIVYVALALTLDLLARQVAAPPRAVLAAAVLLAVPLAAVNVLDRQAVLAELGRSGGVGLASDAIVRFAEDNRAQDTRAFFPDWGIFMSFEMVTGGRVPVTTDFSAKDARKTLCAGQDVLLGIMDGAVEGQPDPARVADPTRLPNWIAEIDWGQPEVTVYRQRDGTPVLHAVRWRAATPTHAPCTP